MLAYSTLNSLKSKNILSKNILNYKIKRNFLTENYHCFDQWDKYLMSDVVKKIGPVNTFSFEISKRLTDKSLVTPLDMDLLATKLVHVNNFQELEFIENLFIDFRKTQSALYVRDSMHYSFVRNYIDLNQAERLLQILKLKYKYGLFLDNYTTNILMSYFIKQNDSKKAALTAHEVLLQENDENELTQAGCLFSCLKYIKDYGTNEPVVEAQNDENEKKTKILVSYLRSNYNDEHFDLKSIPLLTGKTIYFTSKNTKTLDSTLRDNLKIYGLLIFGKYEKAVDLFELNNGKNFKFIADEFKKVNEEMLKDEEKLKKNQVFVDKWSKHLSSNENYLDKNFDQVLNEIENYLKQVVKTQTDIDIKNQQNLFTKWTKEQENELEKQIKNFEIELKKESILKRLDDLELQEERLTFFDKRQEIIDSYYGKGFSTEYPSDIPVEPEESTFKKKSNYHFKPWPKYMNRPKSSYGNSKAREAKLESLRKIYLTNDNN